MDCWKCRAVIPEEGRFCPHCGAPLRAAGGPAALAERNTPAFALEAADAHRRQLTILFADLVNSSGLSQRLDPEDLRDVMLAYERACAGAIERFDGAVLQVAGDGVLCVFGYPRAHEDDPERAINAGLAIVEAVSDITPPGGDPLRVRVAIATGLVVVADPAGGDPGRASGLSGTTPIMAVRLQSVAPPNAVVVADSTRQLVGDVFRFESLGDHPLRGFAEPVRAWRVAGRGDIGSRYEALRVARELTPLIGREDDLDLLLDRCRRVDAGSGQVVLIAGEPGMGKSRTVRALRDYLPEQDWRFIYCYCSPHHQNTALYPVISLLERTYRLGFEPSPARRLETLRAMVARTGQDADRLAPLLAQLLAIPVDEAEAPLDLSPQRARELTIEAALGQLFSLAGELPPVFVFENTHWVDPTTLELLGLLVERVRTRPAVLIVTYRPESPFPRIDLPHVTVVGLVRLTPGQCAAMVRAVAGQRELPPDVVQAIVAKADGVPLFVEELTKAVLDSGFLRRDGDRSAPGEGWPPLTVPVTLQDSLMARLDRSTPAREVAQIAATIGREFSYELLTEVSAQPEPTLRAALDRLVDANILFAHGTPPRASYIFRHALLQDAAYASLLRSRRRRLHAVVADALETRFPDVARAKPELLAHHCTEAGLAEKAVGYWLEAGQQACNRSANAEAAEHFKRGLAVLDTLPDTPETRRQALELLVALGPALMVTRGPGTPETEAAYRRALDLCAGLPETPLHFAAHWGWWRIIYSTDLRVGRERADTLLALAQRLGDAGLLLQAHHCLWATLFNLGDQVECCRHVEAGLGLYRADAHGHHASLYGGHDPKVCGHGERALALWLLGCPEQALASLDEGVRWARELGHAGSIAHTMDVAVMLHRYRRDACAVHRQAQLMIDFAEEQALRDHKAKGGYFRGWARALLGEPAQGLAEMKAGLAAQLEIGTAEDFPVYYDMLAEVHALLGQLDEGLDALGRAFEAALTSGLGYWEAELHRRTAELLSGQHGEDNGRVRDHLDQALAIARRQNARSLELRIATTRVGLARGTHEVDEAAALLRSVYAWFSEGFDTLDLGEAEAMLAAPTVQPPR